MKNLYGILLTVVLAIIAIQISSFIPYHLISASVFALLIGMALNPLMHSRVFFKPGIQFVSKKILRAAIILMGLTLSFSQVLVVGSFSLFVMVFTLFVAFGGGYLFGKLFNMNWKLSSLISAGTGICGGSAIAAIAPVIHAKDKDVAYAISATFIFDVLMVILFPIMGRHFGMSDMGFGLWAGTAVNDTSSVVAAGYAFSDAAGAYSVIVKLTRTLSIIPIVIIFSIINQRLEAKEAIKNGENSEQKNNLHIGRIFPYFILFFLVMVGLKSLDVIPAIITMINPSLDKIMLSENLSFYASEISKFCMVMALGAIGLKTHFKEVATSGFKPMLHGFIISALVVIVAFLVQSMIGQL